MSIIDGVIDTSTARILVPKMVPAVYQQAKDIVDAHGGAVKRLVIGPNVRVGAAFRPLTGFVIELAPDAAFVSGHYDTQNLFRGRCMLPLIPITKSCDDEKPMLCFKKSLSDDCLIRFFMAAKCKALCQINEDPAMMSLTESASEPGSCCLIFVEGTNSHFVVVETHMLPHEDALGEDISAFLARATADKLTVKDTFLSGNAVGRTMIRYLLAQKAYREYLCRHMRKMLLGHFFSKAMKHIVKDDDTDAAVHFVTNVANMSADGKSFLFFSDTIEATMMNGAIIGAGPFKPCVWVNHNGKGSEMLVSANAHGAVPYNMPISISLTEAIVKILKARANNTNDAANFAARTEDCKNYTHLYHEVVKSGPVAQIGGSLCMPQQRCVNVVGDLVWPHYIHCTGQSIETVSPHEYLDYMRGVEYEPTKNALLRLGVDFVNGVIHTSLLTPLFCVSDSPSVQTTIALVEAIASVACDTEKECS